MLVKAVKSGSTRRKTYLEVNFYYSAISQAKVNTLFIVRQTLIWGYTHEFDLIQVQPNLYIKLMIYSSVNKNDMRLNLFNTVILVVN